MNAFVFASVNYSEALYELRLFLVGLLFLVFLFFFVLELIFGGKDEKRDDDDDDHFDGGIGILAWVPVYNGA
ncbi:hypothetical protein GC174_08695 [bacterium]|nr:hypothetical protein [bacterium]